VGERVGFRASGEIDGAEGSRAPPGLLDGG
jgi:hypothetical protein